MVVVWPIASEDKKEEVRGSKCIVYVAQNEVLLPSLHSGVGSLSKILALTEIGQERNNCTEFGNDLWF